MLAIDVVMLVVGRCAEVGRGATPVTGGRAGSPLGVRGMRTWEREEWEHGNGNTKLPGMGMRNGSWE